MVAFENIEELLERIKKLQAYTSKLNELDSAIEGSALEELAKLVSGLYAIYYEFNYSNEVLHAIEGFAIETSTLSKNTYSLGEGLPGQVAKMRQPHSVESVQSSAAESLGLENYALHYYPITTRNTLFGIVEIATPQRLEATQEKLLRLALSFLSIKLEAKKAQQTKETYEQDAVLQNQKLEEERQEIQMQKDAVRHNFDRLQKLEALEKENEELNQKLSYTQGTTSTASAPTSSNTNFDKKSREIDSLKKALQEKERQHETEINSLNRQLAEEKQRSVSTVEEDKQYTERLTKFENEKKALAEQIELLKAEMVRTAPANESEFAQRIQKLKTQHRQQNEENANKLAESQRKVQELTEALRNSSNSQLVASLEKELTNAKQQLERLTQQNAKGQMAEKIDSDTNDVIIAYEQKLEAFSQRMFEYQTKIEEKHASEIKVLEKELSKASETVRKLQASVSDSEKTSNKASSHSQTLQQEIDNLKQTLLEKDNRIEELRKEKLSEQQGVSRDDLLEYEHKLSSALQLAQAYKEKLENAEQTIDMMKRQNM